MMRGAYETPERFGGRETTIFGLPVIVQCEALPAGGETWANEAHEIPAIEAGGALMSNCALMVFPSSFLMVFKGWRALQSLLGTCNGSITGEWVEADEIAEEEVEGKVEEVVEEVVEESQTTNNAHH
ncbi:hypothetical protein MMC31_004068 [Peltigera leucophlebia]|nr:hypothetical protein [Peltigera leucophlebia]